MPFCGRFTCDILTVKRFVALAVGCLAKLVAGSTSVFGIYSNAVKRKFQYTQSEVALVASMHIVGTNLVLPAGILYDKFGPFWTNFVGFCISTVGYGLVYSAVLMPEVYSTRNILFSFYFFLSNHGTLYMYMASLVTNIKNFPPKHRAKVVALLDTMYGLGMSVFFSLYSEFFVNGHETDEQNQDLSGFILLLLVLTSTTALLCILFLRLYPYAESVEVIEMEQKTSDLPTTFSLIDNEDLDESSSEGNTEDFEYEREEERSLLPYLRKDLWTIFFSIKFISLMNAFVLIASTTGMFNSNLTAITKSLGFSHYNWPLTLALTMSGLVMRFVMSPLSDFLYPRIPRIAFLIGGDTLSVISYVILLCFVDNLVILVSGVILVGVSVACSYTFSTTILSEHFGTAHFGLHFGIFKAFDAISGFGLQRSFGAIYDSNIGNITEGEHNCFGKECVEGSFALATVTSTIGTLCAAAFFLKHYIERKQISEH